MHTKQSIWHDQLFFILLGAGLLCYGLSRFLQVRVFAWPAMVLMAPRSMVGGLFSTMHGLQHENQRLAELCVRQELDNAYWREQAGILAGDSLSAKYNLRRAAIVGRDPQSLTRTLVVDRGLLSGVQTNMAAITDAGVAGRVIEAGANLSFIGTVLNPRVKIAAMDGRSRAAGVVSFREGYAPREGNLLAMDYVLPELDVAVGDTIVTSGTGGIFPKGLRVGIVVRVDSAPRGLFRRIDIKPAVDIGTLENLYLIEPRDWDAVRRHRQEAIEALQRKEQAELRRLMESSNIEEQ